MEFVYVVTYERSDPEGNEVEDLYGIFKDKANALNIFNRFAQTNLSIIGNEYKHKFEEGDCIVINKRTLNYIPDYVSDMLQNM
jgi:hypothetical protein